MITLYPFLIVLLAASLPAIYLFLVSLWIEPEYRKRHAAATSEPAISTNNLKHRPTWRADPLPVCGLEQNLTTPSQTTASDRAQHQARFTCK